MKNALTGTLLILLFTVAGCQINDSPEVIRPIIDPPPAILIGRDSIASGSYLGMDIHKEAETIYATIQSLTQKNGVSYLNVVSNFSSDLTQLRNRIPLYDYLLLDEAKGTESGVQITLEDGQVKSIFLNSGKELRQWPLNSTAAASIRVGDQSDALYDKFVKIHGNSAYSRKFECVLLLTKNLSTSFDPAMAQSPQWYFAYKTGPDLWELVQMHLKDGKLNYIIVERYKN